MTSIVPVLMCGGAGTRLWPLSRKSYPKQFVPLIGDTSLFQASALRLTGGAFTPPLVLT
ncbi:MAG TPA: mannose-1-phosphate guanylyltransferase/mannose-6-phosphate isomerase, partial [Hyphomonas sp.]|nr:mannose-1-phosphate guanylyltransferase/mannose-6-phosphate isomerase [Hyphomonas sp.]